MTHLQRAIALALVVFWNVPAFVLPSGSGSLRQAKATQEEAERIACVGDSITIGLSLDGSTQSYPAVLQQLLGTSYNVQNYGISGTTAMHTGDFPYSATAEYQQSLAFQPNIVILMFGTNDASLTNWQGKELFKEEYRTLIQSYVDLASQPTLYLCTLTSAYDINGTTEGELLFEIQKEAYPDIIAAVEELADELHLNVIDVFDVTSDHPEWYQVDGIHPNEDGAYAIAEEVYSALMDAGSKK